MVYHYPRYLESDFYITIFFDGSPLINKEWPERIHFLDPLNPYLILHFLQRVECFAKLSQSKYFHAVLKLEAMEMAVGIS
jgi:hypothetical protein